MKDVFAKIQLFLNGGSFFVSGSRFCFMEDLCIGIIMVRRFIYEAANIILLDV